VCQLDQQVGISSCLQLSHPGALAGIDFLGPGQRQKRLVHQRVIKNKVGLDRACSAKAVDKSGIAWGLRPPAIPNPFPGRQLSFAAKSMSMRDYITRF